jgi:hypothetical protein
LRQAVRSVDRGCALWSSVRLSGTSMRDEEASTAMEFAIAAPF